MKLFFLFFAFLFLPGFSFSQTKLLTANPASEGVSAERLGRIDAQINQWIKEDQLNGGTMIILRHGKIVYYKAFGHANKDVPMRTEHIFRIASMNAERTTMIPAGSYGWDGMFGSHYWKDPKSKIMVVFMRNIWPTEHWDYGDRIKPLIYQSLK